MKIPPSGPHKQSVLKQALLQHNSVIKRALIYSLAIGFLSLAPTLFMLEVYDRVVNSRNEFTLWMLVLLVLGCYVWTEMLELVRHGLLNTIATTLDEQFRLHLFNTAFEANLRKISGGTVQSFNDLKAVRDFINSPAVIAILDAPMAFIFLLIVTIISPWLGAMALVGAIAQVWIAVRTERSTLPLLTQANQSAMETQNYANNTLRNAQVIEALGMMGKIHQRWMGKQRKFLLLQAQASDTAGINNALSKLIQTVLTSLLLGASCWLALKGQMLGGGGMMIVASILGGMVLRPLVQLVAQWRLVVNARDAFHRLDSLLLMFPEKEAGMSLPAPKGVLTVEAVVAGAPSSPIPILRGVSFGVMPGECLMVVGPSAAGKTTLARLLMGLWPAASGKVRLDGADVYNWSKEELGPHLGYLPQTVELFEGTLAENVARFGDINRALVNQALTQVGLGPLVESLPAGLDTFIGEEGTLLSGGQRQRVALARAIYGDPKLLVLDEPNSSLDETGEQALLQTLLMLKARGASIVVITHRTSVLQAADKMLVLRDGAVAAFGPRDAVLAALQKAQQNNPNTSAASALATTATAAGAA